MDHARAEIDGSDAEASEKSTVKEELLKLKELAAEYKPAELKDGSWLVRFFDYTLRGYAEETDTEALEGLYPSFPPDKIAEARIIRARRVAALGGAASGGGYSLAVASVLGSGGAAAPVAASAAIASFVADLLFQTGLQLRLAYDLSAAYGCPLDFERPEDVFVLMDVAFGITAKDVVLSSAGRVATTKAVEHLLSRSSRSLLESVGRWIFKRKLASLAGKALPLVNMPLGAGIAYYMTNKIGSRAKQVFRDREAIRDASQSIVERTGDEDPALLFKIVCLVVGADKRVEKEEEWFITELARQFDNEGQQNNVLASVADAGDLDPEDLLAQLESAEPEYQGATYQAAIHAAAADHDVDRKELKLLKRIAKVCGIEFDPREVKKLGNY